jgi:ribonuclease HII
MHKALDQLKVRPENILVVGNKFYVYKHYNEIIPHICITGGDNKYTSIAAASIIAKVEHDKYINEMCDAHPNLDIFYDLRNNKGYGTKKHIEGIKQHGISSWHRKTFGICRLEFGLEN